MSTSILCFTWNSEYRSQLEYNCNIIQVLKLLWALSTFFIQLWAVFTERPGFNPRYCHTNYLKMLLEATLLNTQDCNVRIKGKSEKEETSSLTPRFSSYLVGILRAVLDYGHQLYFTYIYIYIYIYMCLCLCLLCVCVCVCWGANAYM